MPGVAALFIYSFYHVDSISLVPAYRNVLLPALFPEDKEDSSPRLKDGAKEAQVERTYILKPREFRAMAYIPNASPGTTNVLLDSACWYGEVLFFHNRACELLICHCNIAGLLMATHLLVGYVSNTSLPLP